MTTERQEALDMLTGRMKNRNLVKHCLAVEACMKALAAHFHEDTDLWATVGLVHDLDYEETRDNPSLHGTKTVEFLAGKLPGEALDAILAHAGNRESASLMSRVLCAVDPVTGLLVACALIRPEKKLSAVDADFVLNRFGEKRFAAGADRDQIRTCEGFGLTLLQFIEICLASMKEISSDLGL